MPRAVPSHRRSRTYTLLALLCLLGGMALVPLDAGPAAAATRSITFPVSGGASWSDTWGAPRSGGRSHEGQDLFAPKMRHLVSAVDGTVARVGRGATLSGNYVVVRDAQGWEYVYVHVNNDRPGTDDGSDLDLNAFPPGIYPGAAVYAGQLIGYLGDSGNAETTPPHLHFEIRMPTADGLEPVNPSDSLRAARFGELDPALISGVPFGVTDASRLVPNGVGVVGWALDPDLSSAVRIEAYVDKELVGTFTAPIPRTDIGSAYPMNGPNHGFDTGMVTAVGPREVCLAIRNDVGPAGWLGCDQVDRPVNPLGNLDTVSRVPGGVRFTGWALDADTDAAVTVEGQIGTTSAQTSAQLSRNDLTSAFPGFGTSHGFDLTVASGPGSFAACATAFNAAGVGGTTGIGCKAIELQSEPLGAVDVLRTSFGSVGLQGWALDPDTSDPIEVHTYIDGTGYNLGLAQADRKDVAAAFPGWGSGHGFGTTIPASPGRHSVCVFGISKSYGSNAAVRCADVVMATGGPFGVVDEVTAVASGVRVTGWAVDPDTSDGVETHVYVNGIGTNLGSAMADRPDVAAAYPGAGAAHGFDATISTSAAHPEVCVFAIDRRGGQSPSHLGCRTI